MTHSKKEFFSQDKRLKILVGPFLGQFQIWQRIVDKLGLFDLMQPEMLELMEVSELVIGQSRSLYFFTGKLKLCRLLCYIICENKLFHDSTVLSKQQLWNEWRNFQFICPYPLDV